MKNLQDALYHIGQAKRRIEEAEGLIRASSGHGAFRLLSYSKFELGEAMKYIPLSSTDWPEGD